MQSLLEVVGVSSIIVCGLDESVKTRIAFQAKQHGHSMVAEVRDIPTRAATRPNIGLALLHAGQSVGGIDELPVNLVSGHRRPSAYVRDRMLYRYVCLGLHA